MSIPQIKAKAEAGLVDAREVRYLIRRLEGTARILADRERELLIAKGPCGAQGCTLHYAHVGPCNMPGRIAGGTKND